MQPGEFTFDLDNFDGRFDPYNSSGPLYGSIEPGKQLQFSVKYNPTGTTYRLFTGNIKDIRPTSQRATVQIIATDALQWLAEQDITIPTAFNATVDRAINLTLDAASYPYQRAIAASSCPITYFDPQQANALDTIRELAYAGLGTVFVDRSGNLKYYDRTTTGQPTHTLDQAVLLKQITITQPWDTVRNKITTVANRFGYGPVEEIWRLDEPIGIPGNSSTSFKIEFDAAQVLQPERGVDYLGYGTLEGFIAGVGHTSVNYLFTVYLTNITSRGATVNASNNMAGYSYLALTIRGRKLVNKKISFESIDATSAAKGPRRLRIDSPWLQDRGYAAAYAPLLLAHLKDPSKDPVITLEARPDGLSIDLLDKVTITSAKLGINNAYDVGYISYQWGETTGQKFTQTLHLHNILYSTAAITSQPYYPELPPVPPVQPPVVPPIEPPERRIDCTQSYPAISGANGPVVINGGVLDNSTTTSQFQLRRWFRDQYHPYRTYVDIDARWEVLTGGVWTLDTSFDFASVNALNSLGVGVATGGLSGAQVSDGIRRYYFSNTHPYYVDRIGFTLDANPTGEPGYRKIDSVVATVTDTAGSTAGTLVTGLGSGNLYAIESSGVYLYEVEAWRECTLFVIKYDGGTFEGSWGAYKATNGGPWLVSTTTSTNVPKAEQIDDSHFRIFLQYTSSLELIAGGNNYPNDTGNDTGTLSFTVYNAVRDGGADKRVTIRSINVYNTCEGGPND